MNNRQCPNTSIIAARDANCVRTIHHEGYCDFAAPNCCGTCDLMLAAAVARFETPGSEE